MPGEAPAASEFDRATELFKANRLQDAEQICRAILARSATDVRALHLLGLVQIQKGETAAAVSTFEAAVASDPKNPGLRFGLGFALQSSGRHAAALDSYDGTLALSPDSVDTWINRGNVLYEMRRFAEALASYDRALVLDPTSDSAHDNRGAVLSELRRYEDALASHDRAIALRPDNATSHINRANALFSLGRLDEALSGHDQAFHLGARDAALWLGRANVLRELKRLPDAFADYHKALAADPQLPLARWNLCVATLMSGDMKTGWPAFECRWDAHPDLRPRFPYPQWAGEDLTGKTILLWGEQGYGDTLQFCRYAPLVAQRGGRVVLRVQPALKRVLANLEGVAAIHGDDEPPPPADVHAALMSLPALLGTTLETVPSQVPYIRTPQVGPTPDSRHPIIGLCWFSNRGPNKERHRSLSLDMLDPILRFEASFIALQKDKPAEWDDRLGQHPTIDDFADTAALIATCDLVISVDTSIAHLAGAMGKPVWILIPYFGTCWRWMIHRTDSPWYPTARLFRQPAVDTWEPAIAEVARELSAFIGSK